MASEWVTLGSFLLIFVAAPGYLCTRDDYETDRLVAASTTQPVRVLSQRNYHCEGQPWWTAGL